MGVPAPVRVPVSVVVMPGMVVLFHSQYPTTVARTSAGAGAMEKNAAHDTVSSRFAVQHGDLPMAAKPRPERRREVAILEHREFA
jgi:hypothetical protein